jgi:hypothetical protein
LIRRYCELTKGQKEKKARGASYRAAELGSKPQPAEVDETEEPELGARARVSEGMASLIWRVGVRIEHGGESG